MIYFSLASCVPKVDTFCFSVLYYIFGVDTFYFSFNKFFDLIHFTIVLLFATFFDHVHVALESFIIFFDWRHFTLASFIILLQI